MKIAHAVGRATSLPSCQVGDGGSRQFHPLSDPAIPSSGVATLPVGENHKEDGMNDLDGRPLMAVSYDNPYWTPAKDHGVTVLEYAKGADGRTLCGKHLGRWYFPQHEAFAGDGRSRECRLCLRASATLRVDRDVHAARFFERVEKTDGCWNWKGRTKSGYGRFDANGRAWMAHRFSYELLIGAVPDGLQLDHLCRNRTCVNPAHLEPVELAENRRRADDVRDSCRNGHPYTGATWDYGSRKCEVCTRERRRRAYLRWKETQ